MKTVLPAREDFVGVALMAHIPYNSVRWRGEDVMKGHGKLNNAEIGGEMAACCRDGRDDQIPYLTGERR